ncbi:ArnT family glycosyltransferase [Polaribacter sargassicola]|uniref:ArnT family glycosyltransferase n=1 Tax=Polaribacter sargassicola TaxID=2836891 RepID=UPI001F181B09|nr:glycosyltransferase family 39 protein [Polaribacter sp. DS7-9]MCG1036854.1 glycosyltransferase family 39 protein [Polaribacter sp. DS7-9]
MIKIASKKHFFINNKTPLLVAGIFLFINLIQAYFTPLLNDESYYWLYSNNLQWGYFDHPPFIAILIKFSTQIFPLEIGVRFINVLLGAFTIFIWCKLIEQETKAILNSKLTFLLLGGSLFINLYTFHAIPDTPLLFFEALFFWLYSKYLKNDQWKTVIPLSIVIALLIYTKYHGVLIVFFTLLSNLKILKRKSAYLIFALVLALFTPHIYWLFENDFQTIRFQLFERTASGFKLKNILSYVGEQLGLTGPIFILLFSILYKTKNQFQKTLKYNTIGVFIFFLINSFRVNINAYWTVIAWFPMLFLCYLYFTENKPKKSYLGLLIFNITLVIFLRFAFLFEWNKIAHFNDRNLKVMAATLKKEANGDQLVFLNTFIEPAAYMFYENEKCFSINNVFYKRTQFNYLDTYENLVQNKPVLLVAKHPLNKVAKKIDIPNGKTYYVNRIENFKSYYTTINVKSSDLYGIKKSGENLTVNYTVDADLSSEEKHTIANDSEIYLQLNLIHTETKKFYSYKTSFTILAKDPTHLEIKLPTEKGKYNCVFSINRKNYNYLNGFNSLTYSIDIE